MNAFDYLFEKTKLLNNHFLVGKETITYSQLYNESITLAKILRSIYGAGNNIMIISVNNLFFLKAYLAIIKSGNICIPIDPGIEIANFKIMADITNPVAIFITRDVYRKIHIDQFTCYFPDKMPENIAEKERMIAELNSENDCAEIIFTSGSTGKPKGVMISHKNLIANTESIISYLMLKETDRMMVVLPLYYCYGLSLLHTHLRVGGSIVFNNSFLFLGTIIRNLIDYKCTGFAGVPSHFQILLRKTKEFKKTKFPELRYVTQAGGKLATIFIDEFRECFPDVSFYVMYGQTEATARLSYLPPEKYEAKKGSIGKGIPGVKLKVIDGKGIEVNPGDIGEIIAYGENIMLGYYKDEQASKEVLSDKWLHTGDIGTIDDEGYIYLTGRKKEIIKVGGKRISPKEIESVILEISEVIDCQVVGIPDEILGEKIKATIVLGSQPIKSINAEFVRQHCFSRLAAHKIPQVIEFSDQLNISASGKKIREI